MNSSEILDLVIVGAGPIGLAAACTAQDAKLSSICIDKGGLCQTISEFAPRQSFYSPADELEIGGVPFPIASDEKPRREDALAYYRAVVSSRKLPLRTWERVIRLRREGDILAVTTRQEPDEAWELQYRARTVILASGVWDQPRTLDVPGAHLKKVRIRYEDPTPYYGKKCLVVGGGNSAAEVAMALSRAGAETTIALVEESWDACRLRPFVLRELLILVEERRIAPLFRTSVRRIETDIVHLEGPEGETSVANDFVFTMIGNVPDIAFLQDAEIAIDPADSKPLYDESTFETGVPGVYVAGSISREAHIVNGRPRAVKIVRHIAQVLGRVGAES
jgi:thioredoxin reductase (NADPH)